MVGPLEIFCDESGQTGPNLLDPDQRLFTYGAGGGHRNHG
ncbi:MAG: DUF3800 domain-containing protein [Sphingomonas sp.]